jgi:hypothetical protein
MPQSRKTQVSLIDTPYYYYDGCLVNYPRSWGGIQVQTLIPSDTVG